MHLSLIIHPSPNPFLVSESVSNSLHLLEKYWNKLDRSSGYKTLDVFSCMLPL